MATIVNEVIVTGRVKRRLIDKAAKLWQRLSYWTKASDVEFNDGKTAEEKLGNINGISSDIDEESDNLAASMKVVSMLRQSFQDGCDKIVGNLTALGYTPEDPQGADEINDQIRKIYVDQYKDGLAASKSTKGNVKIQYTYHKHTSACYKTITKPLCDGPVTNLGELGYTDGDGKPFYNYHCEKCGSTFPGTNSSHGGGTSRELKCNKTTSTIEKAEITFE